MTPLPRSGQEASCSTRALAHICMSVYTRETYGEVFGHDYIPYLSEFIGASIYLSVHTVLYTYDRYPVRKEHALSMCCPVCAGCHGINLIRHVPKHNYASRSVSG